MSIAENKLKIDAEHFGNNKEGSVRVVAVFLVVLFIGLIEVFMAGTVGASSASLWSDGSAAVIKNIPLSSGSDNTCLTYRQDIFISEYGGTRSVCMYGDEHLRIGHYFENGRYHGAVGFAFSNDMHALDGVCTMVCRYSSATDTLVTLQPVTGNGSGLVVYRHASQRIKQTIRPPLVKEYAFDATHPDYEMKNNVGRYISTPTFNISRNGQWVVAELYDHGTVVLDVGTLIARQITTSGPGYGYGMDPSEQLAISDDGKSVAVMGDNGGFSIFDVTSSCGQPLVGNLVLLPDMQSCPSGDIGIHTLFPNFYGGSRPRFFGNGHELEVTVTSWVEGVRRMMFGVHGTAPAHQLELLSLGDSFSSGEGETDDKYYMPGTNQLFDTCHVSSRAYAGIIALRLGIIGGEAKNVSCSGATTGDVVGNDAQYWGQGNRLGAVGLKLTIPERDAANEAALDNFQPGRTLQANFIDRYAPEFLTIGIGGNDAGLMGKLRTCAMPGTCEWAREGFRAATASEIARLSGTLGALFSRIADLVEHSKVFIVGYPSIIDPDGPCDPLTGYLLDHTERLYIQNSIHYLDQVIHLAAKTAGFHYVDVEHSFDGKQLCSGASVLAMNGVRLGGDVALIPQLPMLKIIGLETFHPTPLGHSLIADTILAQYPGLSAETAVDDGFAANPASYWEDGVTGAPTLYRADFATNESKDSRTLEVQLPDGSLQAGSTVTVEVHSDPIQVASYVANEKGGVRGVITLPDTLRDGFHTLHLLGSNRTGDPVDMYQFLTVGSEGEVVNAGIGGDTTDASRQSDTSVESVLGAEVNRGSVPFWQKAMVPIASSVKQMPSGVQLLVGGVIVGVLAVVLFVMIVLVRRRWSKPSS